LVFTGTYDHSIDAKKRLSIPSDIRAQISRSEDGKQDQGTYLYVTLGEGQALCLYTEKEFERRAEQLDDSDRVPDEILDYERMFYSLSRRVELDKNGRVRLPENLLAMAKLGSEVVLLGVKDHLEVRDRDQWRAHVTEKLAADPQILMNPRRAMQRPAETKS
jgi:MraZ protein